jgi:glycosyltransferase involved in cell wall biosynthesis
VSIPILLQIVPALSGGVGRATLDAAQAVIGAGGSAIVASPGGTLLPDLLRLRASHLELPHFDSPVWARLSLPARLAASVRDLNVNVVQARSPATAWIAGALARRLHVKWIATLHDPFIATSMVGRMIERRQLNADAVIAVSAYVARDALKRNMQLAVRQHTIAPGVNLDRFDPAVVKVDRMIRLASELRVPDGSHVVLFPAHAVEDRGQKLLIEAIKRLDRADVFCLLLGSSGAPTPFEKELETASNPRN